MWPTAVPCGWAEDRSQGPSSGTARCRHEAARDVGGGGVMSVPVQWLASC